MSLTMRKTRVNRRRTAGAAAVCLLLVVAAFTLSYAQDGVYVAELRPVNQQATQMSPMGKAEFRVTGDTLTITVTESNLSPGVVYLQHLHGFMTGDDAVCATPEQDFNSDGIIDIREAEQASGIDMVPMNDNPAGLEIVSETYPVSSPEGVIRYSQTVSMSELRNAVKAKYGVDDLDLEDMVLVLHGVDPGMTLPASVKSAHGLPPQMTLPIACGELEEE